ncbi:gamma-glutamyl-gamma-aminobutyrate hydrolase family protein [Chelativorans sp.]|uniref:gamma-glutamyl-gamma-aminobutyrate hydrolase family protein n=1 Tax=Chelativorans sp. TaxID=2203393 RepID=UPI002810ABCA|nr:gamma-glutamyl-gamma-aminobutyrate hydrolase family protein [Chelativorans sp.]
MPQPLVALPTDVKVFEGYTWHATPEQYLTAALSTAGVVPVLVPSFGEAIDLDSVLGAVDGLMLTGARSNVYPPLYGGTADEKNGPYDQRRDSTTLPLIRKAIEKGLPLLAICRGIQELNVALGGSLINDIQEHPGTLDHRGPEGTPDERFAIRQKVEIRPGTCLAEVFGSGEIMVNSVHRQAIGQLGSRLQVEAVAPDGTVEAVSVIGAPGFAVGVQWHPEYWAATDSASQRVLRAFGDAVRAHADRRGRQPLAAE